MHGKRIEKYKSATSKSRVIGSILYFLLAFVSLFDSLCLLFYNENVESESRYKRYGSHLGAPQRVNPEKFSESL
jgi:hypothetical protein